jgi:uncharacterized membrane protein YhaH (DUF805 family)
MYWSLKGRMNRAMYWLLLVAVVVIYGLLVAFVKKPPHIAELLMILLGVPRLHDIGRSGWWMALLFGFEVAAIAVGFFAVGTTDGILIAGGLTVFVILIAMMILGCIPGQPNANAYGEPPAPGLSFARTGA